MIGDGIQCLAGDIHLHHHWASQTMNDPSGQTIYSYDDHDRLQSKQTPFGALSYTYYNAGNLLSVNSSNQDGAAVNYSYDDLNRLSTATVPGQAPTTYAMIRRGTWLPLCIQTGSPRPTPITCSTV